jgi:ornithine lipid N-methyltransferase
MQNRFINFWKKLWFSLPSSRFLSERMVSLLDKHELSHVVELGAWKGPLTRELVRKLPPYVRIDIFELEEEAIRMLDRDFSLHKNVHIHHMDAVELTNLFKEESIDAVISTLPLGSIPRGRVHDILKWVASILKTKWQFIQYQYWMANRKDVNAHFDILRTHFEPRNFGPAFIYHAKKKKA